MNLIHRFLSWLVSRLNRSKAPKPFVIYRYTTLLRAAELKHSVWVNGRPLPAAFVANFNARYVHHLLKNGIYLYDKTAQIPKSEICLYLLNQHQSCNSKKPSR